LPHLLLTVQGEKTYIHSIPIFLLRFHHRYRGDT